MLPPPFFPPPLLPPSALLPPSLLSHFFLDFFSLACSLTRYRVVPDCVVWCITINIHICVLGLCSLDTRDWVAGAVEEPVVGLRFFLYQACRERERERESDAWAGKEAVGTSQLWEVLWGLTCQRFSTAGGAAHQRRDLRWVGALNGVCALNGCLSERPLSQHDLARLPVPV